MPRLTCFLRKGHRHFDDSSEASASGGWRGLATGTGRGGPIRELKPLLGGGAEVAHGALVTPSTMPTGGAAGRAAQGAAVPAPICGIAPGLTIFGVLISVGFLNG